MGNHKSAVQLKSLRTEARNLASTGLEQMNAADIVRLMNREDGKVLAAVRKAARKIAEAIDLASRQLARGGRFIYVGAGTSGRIGALDASECAPTFGIDPSTVRYVMAGGPKALGSAAEANEDSPELGREDIAKLGPGTKDIVVGIAASGRTPYTIAALEYARRRGAKTIAISCNPNSAISKVADVAIEVVVGAEVLTGSTRLKAGTAQKMVCNMLTTGTMVRLGYVYGNLMVNMRLKNTKLVERGVSILQTAAAVERRQAMSALKHAGMDVAVALVMLRANVDHEEASRRLQQAQGHVRKAIQA